jgi:hypothetical protein
LVENFPDVFPVTVFLLVALEAHRVAVLTAAILVGDLKVELLRAHRQVLPPAHLAGLFPAANRDGQALMDLAFHRVYA